MPVPITLLLGLLCLIAAGAKAGVPADHELRALATSGPWLNLGHYRPNLLDRGYTSQADDERFFLSPSGRTDPVAELAATIVAMNRPPVGNHNNHARCQFPARYAWLRTRIELARHQVSCADFTHWKSQLNTNSITLVFAASYLNSPSSMFGHTFLRLDPPSDNQDTNLLLANTISYAADAAEHDGELLFAYRGIAGGYPGITSVRPYYEMIKVYSDIENRDLWEYHLNLSPAEVDQLLAHTWEVRNRNFDYYFFDENCAYRLLSLIDVARPGTRLLDEVTSHAIPSDTIRWVVDRNLVAKVSYRPSAATRVKHALNQLDTAQTNVAAAIAKGYLSPQSDQVRRLDHRSQAQLLDATYDYVRHQVQTEGWPRDFAAPLSHQLLTARSALGDQPDLTAPGEPTVRDDQGHGTTRLGLAYGVSDSRHYLEVSLRGAYHHLLDPPAGYRPGAQLQFLELDGRLYQDNQELQVQRLVGVAIRSLTPRDQFFSPLSWQVGFGGRRTEVVDRGPIFTPYLQGGAGYTWQTGSHLTTMAMLTGDLEISKHLHRGFDAAPGLDLAVLRQGDRFSMMAGMRSKVWLVSGEHRQDSFYLEGALHLDRKASLRASVSRQFHFEHQTRWELGFYAYF